MREQAQQKQSEERVDADLEHLWLSGDPEALTHTHVRYRDRLVAVAYRILKNHADAEDVVQKIFLSLRSASYRGDASLWTYLYRAAVNRSVNQLRSRKRQEKAEQRLIEAQVFHGERKSHDTEAHVLRGEILAQVSKALLAVKPQHRRVLTLRIIHGLTNTEIAEREDLPLPTVGTWLRRGREELQRGLKPLIKEVRRGKP